MSRDARKKSPSMSSFHHNRMNQNQRICDIVRLLNFLNYAFWGNNYLLHFLRKIIVKTRWFLWSGLFFRMDGLWSNQSAFRILVSRMPDCRIVSPAGIWGIYILPAQAYSYGRSTRMGLVNSQLNSVQFGSESRNSTECRSLLVCWTIKHGLNWLRQKSPVPPPSRRHPLHPGCPRGISRSARAIKWHTFN